MRIEVGFFVEGFGTGSVDPNPIIEEGNRTETAGINAILDRVEHPRISPDLDAPRRRYSREGEPSAAGAQPVVPSCDVILQEMNGKPNALSFELTDDDSSVLVVMNMTLWEATYNNVRPTYINYG